jgi:hypothetical protein
MACATAVKPHPGQLFLPFNEAQPRATGECERETDGLEGDRLPLPRSFCTALAAPPCKRLDALRGYLRHRFPGFVLQQRTQPAGTIQLSLYRIPDGAFYRINVTSRFLDGDWLDELEGFLDYHGLCDKVPASVLSPIIIDREGVHVPKPPMPPEEGGDLLRSRLRKILGWKGKEEGTGLSFAP